MLGIQIKTAGRGVKGRETPVTFAAVTRQGSGSIRTDSWKSESRRHPDDVGQAMN